MTIKIKVMIGVAIIAVIALSITAIAFMPVSFPGRSYGPEVEFKVEKGDGLNTIANNLYKAGLIRSTLAFKIFAVVSGSDKNLQAGIYKLSTNSSVRELVSIFANGFAEDQSVLVTIPEGSNINDIDLIFAKSGLTNKTDFLIQELIAKEGYLFPDTYRFLPGTIKTSIISKLENTFGNKVDNKTDTRTIIIASILEKEVKTAEDMKIVAGIIEKRLTLGMLLQLDATVAYGECRPKFLAGMNCEVKDVNIIEGIKHSEPYNSYKYKGLPPGPISNPGIKAIDAASHPTTSDYLFYLTDKAGKVYYARTAAEHNRNRAKYLNK